jgi:SulP family sulfate permease
MLDFAVIMAVVAVALVYSLIAASAVGIALAMFLFIREQLTSTIIRNKLDGQSTGSRNGCASEHRNGSARAARRAQTAIVELQGSLFFGTKDQLYSALEPELGKRNYIAAGHASCAVGRRHGGASPESDPGLAEAERGAFLVFSGLDAHPAKRTEPCRAFRAQMELTTTSDQVKVFHAEVDDATRMD